MNQDRNWLDQAAAMPVAFALVREDPLLDLEVVTQAGTNARVLMIASGGCTAALLATLPGVAHLHLVDPNPAQLALARLKLHLLANVPTVRQALLGHAPLPSDERGRQLGETLAALGLTTDVLGPPEIVATIGPDHAGRYELLFAQLREALSGIECELTALLELRDPAEQARRTDPSTQLGRAIDIAYDTVLALPNLIRLFGEGATQNPVEPFSRHFAHRTRVALATLPAADNTYLWLMLAGRLPASTPVPWLSVPTPARLPEVLFTRGMMADVLATVQDAERYHVVHLSNILDWLTPAEARRTLELAWRALFPGGQVIIRQLNSTLDIRALDEFFHWQGEQSEALHQRDRSFFYRSIHLGRKA